MPSNTDVPSAGAAGVEVKLAVGGSDTVIACVAGDGSVSPKLFVTCKVTSNSGEVPGVPVIPPKSTVIEELVNNPDTNDAPAGNVH